MLWRRSAPSSTASSVKAGPFPPHSTIIAAMPSLAAVISAEPPRIVGGAGSVLE